MKIIDLVLTDLDKPKKINKRTFYLSDWININNVDKKKLISKPFKNYKDKIKGYRYLNRFRIVVENKFANYLYLHHNKNYSKILLKNVSSLWVGQYLQFIYIRWLITDQVIKQKDKINISDINIDEEINNYLDALDFMDLAFENDAFNYFHIKKIFNFRKKDFKKKIIFKKKKLYIKKTFVQRDTNKKLLIKTISFLQKFFEKILLPFTKKNRVFLKEGFSYKNLLFLNLRLYQIPFFGDQVFNWYQVRKKFKPFKDYKLNALKIHKKSPNNFEKYIFENIIEDAPSIYFNNLSEVSNLAEKILLNPKIIISSHSHFYNELFKIWAFKRKIEKKSKLLIFQHGGNHSNLNPVFDYEKKVSTEFFDWRYNKKKLSGMTKYLNYNIKRKKNEEILFIGIENRKYPCRIYPGPLHHDEMKSIEHFQYLSKVLGLKYKKNLFYIPNRTILPKHKKEILKTVNKKQILKNLTLKQNLKNFSLVICSSPMTTFFDSILSGPTVLLIEKEYWMTNKKIEKKYELLKKNKILFYNVNDLIKHLKTIYPKNIHNWWNSKDVSSAVNQFLREFNYEGNNRKFESEILKKLSN